MVRTAVLQALKKDPRGFFERGRKITAIQATITAKKEQAERWRSIAELTAVKMGVCAQKSGPSRKLESSLCKATVLEEEIEEIVVDLWQTYNEIEWAIKHRIKDPEIQALFELRYINCATWEKIGERLFMSDRWARELHKRALEGLSKTVPCTSAFRVVK